MYNIISILIILFVVFLAIVFDSPEESKELCIEGLTYRLQPDKEIVKSLDGMSHHIPCSD